MSLYWWVLVGIEWGQITLRLNEPTNINVDPVRSCYRWINNIVYRSIDHIFRDVAGAAPSDENMKDATWTCSDVCVSRPVLTLTDQAAGRSLWQCKQLIVSSVTDETSGVLLMFQLPVAKAEAGERLFINLQWKRDEWSVCAKEGQSHWDASHNRRAPAALRPAEVTHKCVLRTFPSAKIYSHVRARRSIGRLFPGCSWNTLKMYQTWYFLRQTRASALSASCREMRKVDACFSLHLFFAKYMQEHTLLPRVSDSSPTRCSNPWNRLCNHCGYVSFQICGKANNKTSVSCGFAKGWLNTLFSGDPNINWLIDFILLLDY